MCKNPIGDIQMFARIIYKFFSQRSRSIKKKSKKKNLLKRLQKSRRSIADYYKRIGKCRNLM